MLIRDAEQGAEAGVFQISVQIFLEIKDHVPVIVTVQLGFLLAFKYL